MIADVKFIINEKGEKEAVVIDVKIYEKMQKELNSLKESLYLLKSSKNRERLLKSIKDVKEGKLEYHDLIED